MSSQNRSSNDSVDADSADLFAFKLSDIAEVFSAAIRPFIALSVVAIALSYFYIRNVEPEFAIVSEIVLERKQLATTSDLDGESVRFNATQAEILKSPLVVEAALERHPLSDKLSEEARLANLTEFAWVKEQMVVSTIAGTQVIAIVLETTEPEHGADLLDEIVSQYVLLSRGTDVDQHSDTLSRLQDSADELRAKLARLQGQFQRLRGQNSSLGDGDEALSLHKKVAEDYNAQRVVAQSQLARRAAELADFNRVLAAQDMETLAGQYLKSETARAYGRARVQLAKLRADFFDAHPDVVAAQIAVDDLRASLIGEARQSQQMLVNARRTAQSEVDRLERQYQLAIDKAKAADIAQLDQQSLRTEIESTQQLLEAELARINDRSIAIGSLSSGQAGTVAAVIRKPSVPLEAIWPRPNVIYALTLLLAGMIAGLIGLFRVMRSRNEEVSANSVVIDFDSESASSLMRQAARKRVGS